MSYFSVSEEFIILKTEKVIIFASALITISGFIFAYFDQFLKLYIENYKEKENLNIRSINVFFWTLGVILISRPYLGDIASISLPILLVVFGYIVFLFYIKAKEEFSGNVLYSAIVLLVIFLFAIAPIYTFQLGKHSAQRKHEFSSVTIEKESYIVARVYDDNVVLVALDKNHVGKEYLIRNLSSLNGRYKKTIIGTKP